MGKTIVAGCEKQLFSRTVVKRDIRDVYTCIRTKRSAKNRGNRKRSARSRNAAWTKRELKTRLHPAHGSRRPGETISLERVRESATKSRAPRRNSCATTVLSVLLRAAHKYVYNVYKTFVFAKKSGCILACTHVVLIRNCEGHAGLHAGLKNKYSAQHEKCQMFTMRLAAI
ncbi:PREDICTED: uncharacterized protein LOC105449243 [Wasmannia auropunctata]|uniref:uncharacterized protein LOC105449243 n=1 Tax=Wasmannia auropunctata TaxID=64793 RepID=UPI0005ED498F|nr:PREDICTED: uncharacterized protein LOC105449243 [Wasmannia auropunctata]